MKKSVILMANIFYLRKKMKILLSLLFIFIHFTFSFAQESKKSLKKQCDALLTKQIVERIATESSLITNPENRIDVLLKVADFLWTSDVESSRTYFLNAFKVANDNYIEKPKNEQTSLFKQDYRYKVVTAIAKRDAEMAKNFIDKILKDFEEKIEKAESANSEKEIYNLLRLAAGTSDINPSFTLQVTRRAMKYDLTSGWYFILYEIGEKNPQLASQIYLELLSNYRNSEVFRLLYLSAFPFANEKIIGAEKFSFGTNVSANLQANKSLQRQFLTVLFNRLLQLSPENNSVSTNSYLSEKIISIYALNEIESSFIADFPELIQLFSTTKIHVLSSVSNDDIEKTVDRKKFNDSAAKNFAERLEELKKDEGEGKLTDTKIVQLLISAKTKEEFDLGADWLEKIQNESSKIQTVNYFFFNRAMLDVREKRFDEARKNAQKLDKIEDKSIIYFALAEAVYEETKNKTEAMDEILEAEKLADKSPDSIAKAQIYLGLANIYVKFDKFNALDALSKTTITVNKLKDGNIFDSFLTREIKTSNFSFFAGYSLPGFDLNNVFYEISKIDFQNSLNYAQSFNDKYYESLATLATVKDCEKNTKSVSKKDSVKKQ